MTDFVLLITEWYRQNARDLPWRRVKNPYSIWLSEVILQQTRVDQGMNYYYKFTEQFPTVTDLANAHQEEVLKCWQGLGYYSRARNLHATAQQIVEKHGGNFPATYEEIIALKGIGPYTAAAIASFSFGLKHAVVDGNVYRVLSRYFAIDEAIDSTQGKKIFQALADSLIPAGDPGTYNQAIMEFGAKQCTPKNPDCMNCPLQTSCKSFGTTELLSRPFKAKKTAVRKRYFHYFDLHHNDHTAWVQRTGKDVWQSLYEFPMIESETEELPSDQSFVHEPVAVYQTKHILSHQHIVASFYKGKVAETTEWELVWKDDNDLLPTHRLMEKYFEFLANL